MEFDIKVTKACWTPWTPWTPWTHAATTCSTDCSTVLHCTVLQTYGKSRLGIDVDLTDGFGLLIDQAALMSLSRFEL